MAARAHKPSPLWECRMNTSFQEELSWRRRQIRGHCLPEFSITVRDLDGLETPRVKVQRSQLTLECKERSIVLLRLA
ncbi:hypothetical protein SCLCIDRAFT_1212219 [Scleroderma citrinum Foug A]|uniref:Uncharacterized protein n=1 Tax=Scleroderma citrinum Foug A TaxID=1036808 RepID=A0A0C3EC22_9AGAM|nr:hypothetical protein SCLCIDRAFT_1212219 [Scleroderma citrinum Foug A]